LIRFILTANLSRLARWLRFLGYDAVLREEMSFDRMTTLAARQRRILLTRCHRQESDPRKFSRKRILADSYIEQLSELRDILIWDEERILSRCPDCNRRLSNIAVEKTSAPQYVREHQPVIRVCRHCGKLFWKGNHEREIRATLRLALGMNPIESEGNPVLPE
jgi:uncharacterized protein with PIN domain